MLPLIEENIADNSGIYALTYPKLMPVWRKQDANLTIERKADNLHRKLTLYIVDQLGYESNYDRLSPLQQFKRVKKVLKYMNRRMGLGWEQYDIEAMALSDVGLAKYAKRWAKQSKIDVAHGENSLVHSLHAMVDTLKFYNASLPPEEKESIEFRNICIRTARAIKEHDRDEQLGEDFTVDSGARAKVNKDVQARDAEGETLKAKLVRVNNQLVASAIESRDFDAYFAAIGAAAAQFAAVHEAHEKLEVIEDFVAEHHGQKPQQSAGQRFVEQTTNQYLLAEGLLKGMNQQQTLTQHLTKGTENGQGSRHAVRFARTKADPDFPLRHIFEGETNATLLGQIDYIDRTPGKIMDTAQTRIEKAIARTAVASMYEALGSILKFMPKYLNLNDANDTSTVLELHEKHRQEGKKAIERDAERRDAAIKSAIKSATDAVAKHSNIKAVVKSLDTNLARQYARTFWDPHNPTKQERLAVLIAREKTFRDDRAMTKHALPVEDIDYLSRLYLHTALLVKEGKFTPKTGEKLPYLKQLPIELSR